MIGTIYFLIVSFSTTKNVVNLYTIKIAAMNHTAFIAYATTAFTFFFSKKSFTTGCRPKNKTYGNMICKRIPERMKPRIALARKAKNEPNRLPFASGSMSARLAKNRHDRSRTSIYAPATSKTTAIAADTADSAIVLELFILSAGTATIEKRAANHRTATKFHA